MIIAIDGLAINGKTTLAKRIADSIGFKYFSAGAIYRCIALTIINKGLDINNIEDTVKAFQKNMSTSLKKEWYITFHTSENVIVVFREKIFALSGKGIIPVYQKCIDTSHAEDKQKWDEMITYAKSLGIPDEQCDFLPEDFTNQDY